MSVISKDAHRTRLPLSSSGNTSDLLKKLLAQTARRKTTSGPVAAETASTTSAASSSRMATAQKPAVTYNDTFKSRGSFTWGAEYEVRWRQVNFAPGVKYPAGSKAIAFAIYKNGKLQKGWTATGSAYLDSAGRAHAPLRTPGGIAHNIISKESFRSDRFNALVKAVNQIRTENAAVKKKGLASLPSAIRKAVVKNGAYKKDFVVTTKGLLLLAALIAAVGAKNVVRNKGALATRLHANILRILKMPAMRNLVLRMLDSVGLKVIHHHTRGRRLEEGESSATAAERVQYTEWWDLAGNAPPSPYNQRMVYELLRERYRHPPTQAQREQAARIARDVMNDHVQRLAHARDLARYFAMQNLTGRVRSVSGLATAIDGLLHAACALREQRITLDQYRSRRAIVVQLLQDNGVANPVMFARMLETMPGFQRTNATFRVRVAIELTAANDLRRAVLQIRDAFSLTAELVRFLLLVALTPSSLA